MWQNEIAVGPTLDADCLPPNCVAGVRGHGQSVLARIQPCSFILRQTNQRKPARPAFVYWLMFTGRAGYHTMDPPPQPVPPPPDDPEPEPDYLTADVTQ